MSMRSWQAGSGQRASVMIVSPSHARRMVSAMAPTSAAGSSSHAGISPAESVMRRLASVTTVATGEAYRLKHHEFVRAGRLPYLERYPADREHAYCSFCSVRLRSRSHPSFSILMCSIATAFWPASRSGSAWNSDTQQRCTL